MRNTERKGSIQIPEEILISILARLPVKSLIRFICVCKHWSDLIGSSSFIRTHLNRNVTKPAHVFLIALHKTRGDNKLRHSLFCNETYEECLDIGHAFGIRTSFVIYGSTNGLVCLSDQTMRLRSPIWICNPSIRKYVVLPKSSIPFQPYYSRNDNVLAFGFHPGLNDYKVVRLISYKKKYHIDVEVYSLSTNSWKKIDEIPCLISVLLWYSGYAMFNGVAYWIMVHIGTLFLVSFDTGSEVFENFQLPDAMASNRHPSIHMYKESVCLLQCGIREQEESVDIWVLQEKSLIYLNTVSLPGMNLSPLGFSINNELIVEYREKHTEGSDLPGSHLSLCSLEIEDDEEGDDTGISLARISYCRHSDYYADTYIESLVLL